MLLDALLKPGAALLNRGIGQSSSAAVLARSLEAKSLRVCMEAPAVNLRITVANGLVQIVHDDDTPADATILGSPLALTELLRTKAPDAIRQAGIDVAGDMEIAEQFSKLMRLARPDPEEALAAMIGDAPAWQLGQAARGFRQWTQGAAGTMARSLSEYLQEERKVLPTRFEAEDLMRQIDELAEDVERAEVRVRLVLDKRAGSAAE